MGNASVRGGKGSQSGYDGEEEGEMDDGKEPNGDDCSSELMSQSPAHSPTEAATLPVLFPPQIPVEPIPDEMYSQTSMWRHGYAENDDIGYDHGIPTMLTWSYGGREVAVEGSWDNWRTRKLLQRSGKEFTLMKVLPSGVYQYRFFVDGEQRYVPDMPCELDHMGNVCNVLDLQESVPDQLDGLAGFEPPQSPESSYYANLSLSLEDFAKEPPAAPPHLHITLLNMQSNVDNPLPMSRPQQAVLNHLYVHKGKRGDSVVALGVTQRFLAKFVTVVLYKSLEK